VKIDYAISLWNYTHYTNAPSLERILAQVREAGYGIELWGDWRDEKDLYDETGRQRLGAALQGMRVSLHTAGANTFDLHKKQVDAAADLGAEVLVLHPDDLYVKGAPRTLDAALANQVVDYARTAGIRLALENGQLPFLIKARDQVEGLYFCLDVGHVYLTTAPMSAFLDALKHRLVHLHLQDLAPEAAKTLRFPGTGIDHYALGAGGIPEQDWRLLFATLEEINFEGTAVFELQPWNPLQTAWMGRAFVAQFTQA